MFDLTHRSALVTGATGGIGRAIAVHLAGQGAHVTLSGTRSEVLDEVVKEIQAQGGKASVLACSLSDRTRVDILFDQVESQFGPCDVLVNNAGITRDSLAMRMTDEAWDTVLEVNLTSCFRLCRSAIKAMMKRRFGRIINISSIVGVTGNPGQTNYCAAKAGMIGFSKSLALEVATRGITVNCVAPGFIETPMTTELSESIQQRILESIPMKNMGHPKDIAAAVVFLASDEAHYITGQTLHVNGGMAMV